MSRSMHLCCMDCKEHLWVGQNDTFYSGEPHTMEALKEFLVAHRTDFAPRGYGDNYHELVYIAEPYNTYIKDFEDQDWKEWNSDYYKKAAPSPNTEQELKK